MQGQNRAAGAAGTGDAEMQSEETKSTMDVDQQATQGSGQGGQGLGSQGNS